MSSFAPFYMRTRISTGHGPKGSNLSIESVSNYNISASRDCSSKLTPQMVKFYLDFTGLPSLGIIDRVLKADGRQVLNPIEREFYISQFGNVCIPAFKEANWERDKIVAWLTERKNVELVLSTLEGELATVWKNCFTYVRRNPTSTYAPSLRWTEDQVHAHHVRSNPAGLMSLGFTDEDMRRFAAAREALEKEHEELNKPKPNPFEATINAAAGAAAAGAVAYAASTSGAADTRPITFTDLRNAHGMLRQNEVPTVTERVVNTGTIPFEQGDERGVRRFRDIINEDGSVTRIIEQQ